MNRMVATILNTVGFRIKIPERHSQIINRLREEIVTATELNRRAGEEAMTSVTQTIVKATGTK